MAEKDTAIPANGYSTTVRKVMQVVGGAEISAANPLPVDAIVTVDKMTINAEMNEASGHDYYVTTTNLGDGTLTVGFDAVSGLVLEDVMLIENKTQGWIYNTKGATVGTTSILLVAANQTTGYPVCGATDEFEIVYRGNSRFTNYIDNGTEFTPDTDKGSAMLGIYSDSAVIAGRVAVPRINSKRNLVVTNEQGVASVSSSAIDLTEAAQADRRFETTFSAAWEISRIEIKFSTAQSRDITIYNYDGTNLFTENSDTGDVSTAYLYPAQYNWFGTATDEVRIDFSQAAGACTAIVRVVYRGA